MSTFWWWWLAGQDRNDYQPRVAPSGDRRNLRKRKLFIVLAVLMAVLLVAVLVVLCSSPEPPSRITEENFERIKPGMTLTEVKAILGPPGNYASPGVASRSGRLLHFGSAMDGTKRVEFWESDAAFVTIALDDSDKTTWGVFAPQYVAHDGAFNRAIGWLRRHWHRWFPE
jgi:hypothetical protein